MSHEFAISALGKEDFVRMKIAESFAELAEQNDFDSITVCDICTHAGISRPTFYHYFESKNAVLHWWWKYAMTQARPKQPLGYDWEADLTEQNRAYLDLTKKHERFNRLCAKSKGFSRDYDSVYEYARRTRIAELTDLVEERTGLPLSAEVGFAIRFFVLAESSTIANWIREGAQGDTLELAQSITRCVPSDLRAALDQSTQEV